MNKMKTVLVARKTLIESWREPQLLLLTLAFPLFMMVLTSMRIFKRNMAEYQISAMYVSLYQRLHGRYYSQLWQLE